MQVTSLLSQKPGDHQHHHKDDHCDGCGHDHEHTEIRLNQILIGLLFVVNSFIIHYFFDNGKVVGDINAMIGAALLGYPIVWTAIKDLRKGRLSTNELVALAVLASFASGEYQESGLVAFFMLLGEIIETRTAEGARASIESLVKLTPTKARRIKGSKEEEVEVKDLNVETLFAFVLEITLLLTVLLPPGKGPSIRQTLQVNHFLLIRKRVTRYLLEHRI